MLVNHVGFPPAAAKYCMRAGTKPAAFTVVHAQTARTVHRGILDLVRGDFGDYLVGDFTALKERGTFEIHSQGARAASFAIDAEVYTSAVCKCVEYFSKQRCGDSRTGHHAPCHLDDGWRRDSGQHQDVSGGWHDACDLRKWVNATIYGMIGLSRSLDLLGSARLDRERVIEEMRWGNQYFRKMQAPEGYVMDYCGGDDGNNYTDNRIGTADDRLIHIEPCELPGQFHFIAAQAAMSRHTRESDPAYARSCEEAANECLEWCVNTRSTGGASSLGAAILAMVELHRATGLERAEALAVDFASKLLALQVTDPPDASTGVRGFFRAVPDRPDPSREIMHGNLPLLALCEILEHFPEHPQGAKWRQSLKVHAEYLLTMASRSAFGTLPFGLYLGQDPGGGRRIGSYWYRWFMKPRGEYAATDWWVGINAHLACNGIGMSKASRLLGEPRLGHLAQRQLDWILGVNPFNASTMTGVGRQQPVLYRTGTFSPPTPAIDGGVMNGLGGSEADEARLDPSSYNTCEYWTPMVAFTSWLLGELQIRTVGA